MRDDSPPPTFSSRRDRLAYLLGRYRWIVSASIIGVVGLLIYVQPSLPTIPRWVGPVILANLLLGLPGFIAGRKFAEWLRAIRWEHVYHINGLTGVREKWLVPPETWRQKKVRDVPPNQVNEKQDWEVRRFEWEEDVEQLTVQGTWPPQAKTGDLVTYKTYFEDIHETLLESHRTLKQLRARWHRMAMDLEGVVINEQAEAQERGTMLDTEAAKNIYEDAKGEADKDDELPDLEAEEVLDGKPTIDETWQDQPANNGKEL
jgi:hypothetical protein